MSRILILPTLFLLIVGVLFFYSTTADVSNDKMLTVASEGEIHTLDPALMSWHQDIRLAQSLYEGLTNYAFQTMAPEPGVAERWDITPDGKTYTFYLRKNARWSDGSPVTADDFVFAWRRALEPRTGSEYRSLFFAIVGAEAYNAELELAAKEKRAPKLTWESVGITSPDPYTLVVKLARPQPYFIDLTSFPTFYPAHRPTMQKFVLDPEDPGKGLKNEWTRHTVGNGAYRIKEWQFKRHFLMEKNPYYWAAGKVPTNLVRVVNYEDQQTAYLQYTTGVVDMLTFLPQNFSAELLKLKNEGKRSDVHYLPAFGSYYFIFNATRPPLNDPRVRRALVMAVDKQAIVRDVTRMSQPVIGTLVPPESIPEYESPQGIAYDVAAAKKLLAEAGYPDGKGMRPIEILYNTGPIVHENISQALGQMWEKNLGVTVTFRGVEGKTFSALRRKEHSFDICRGGWYGDYRDPTTWLDLLRTDNPGNDGLFKDEHYESLLNKAEHEADAQKRLKILNEAEGYALENQAVILPLYQYTEGYLYDDKKLSGVDFNIRLMTQLKFIRKITHATATEESR